MKGSFSHAQLFPFRTNLYLQSGSCRTVRVIATSIR
uniref:Uncharacterized protein n=1 Tax=Arundo donax TaxID=35708 RepID=A0A0A9FVQ1_ARUDO